MSDERNLEELKKGDEVEAHLLEDLDKKRIEDIGKDDNDVEAHLLEDLDKKAFEDLGERNFEDVG